MQLSRQKNIIPRSFLVTLLVVLVVGVGIWGIQGYQEIQKRHVLSSESIPQDPLTYTIPSITPTPVIRAGHSVKFGVVIADYSNSHGGLSSLEQKLGTSLAIISIYKQFGNPDNSDLLQSDLDYSKKNNKTLLIAWEPWDPSLGMRQQIDYVQQIIDGKQNKYIDRFARQIRTYGKPVIIRFGHEMNGNWYPWGDRPEEYKAAYRAIVAKFAQAHITNVAWMWSINAENAPASPIDQVDAYYPGDDVVDSIGIDGFNFGRKHGENLPPVGEWRSFKDIFAPAYSFVLRYHKPISISETASAEEGGNKAEWVNTMFKLDLPAEFPKIQSLVWFDLLKEADWRIDSSLSSLKAFQASL